MVGRRAWLQALIGLAGALVLDPPLNARGRCCARDRLEDWLLRHRVNFLGDCAALGRLGAAYLASCPLERNRELMSRLLEDDATKPFRATLLERIARDWTLHDVTIVDGWVLARTEARLCAALYLMDGTRS